MSVDVRPTVLIHRPRRGQVLTIDPAHDLTFVITSADADPTPINTAILNAFA